jgi:hypothetical protein
MSEMPHCLSSSLERKMVQAPLCDSRIKEINDFLRNLVPNVDESRCHIRGLKDAGDFSSRTELKMLQKVVDCTIEVSKCIQ